MCEALSADDNNQQKARLDRRVAMLTKLGQRGYAVREERGEYRVSRFDTDTDTDSLANDAQGDQLFNLFLQRYLGIRASVLNLAMTRMLSLQRVQQSLQTLADRLISEATILSDLKQLYLALEAWEQAAIEQLLRQSAPHVDKTSLGVERKNDWIHVCSAGDITEEISPSQARARHRRRRQQHSALWRQRHPRMPGLLPVLRALRPRSVR